MNVSFSRSGKTCSLHRTKCQRLVLEDELDIFSAHVSRSVTEEKFRCEKEILLSKRSTRVSGLSREKLYIILLSRLIQTIVISLY
jgi:hypothetical protein